MRIFGVLSAVVIGAAAVLTGCGGPGMPADVLSGKDILQEEGTDMAAGEAYTGASEGREPYAVRTLLREYTAADPEGRVAAYGRYTELIVEDGAPDTLKKEADECNRRAKESVMTRIDALTGSTPGDAEMTDDPAAPEDPEAPEGQEAPADLQFVTYAYITAVTRADDTAFSFLETELETGLSGKRGARNGSEYTYRFTGHTFETETGDEILLSDVFEDEKVLERTLNNILSTRYDVSDPVRLDESGFSWNSDALGIRFCFNSDVVPNEKRWEAGDYSGAAVTAAVPYTALHTEKAAFLADAPEEYIARMETETVYDLPHGDMSVMITEQDGNVVLRRMPDKGKAEDLIIEHADKDSAYFIIRSMGGFCLYRERAAYQEGFVYDFSRPDGGYGRFANHYAQYIDSYLREIGLAFAYDPHCVHMCEKRRSFGKESYDGSSFIPNGHYSFPDRPDSSYKLFVLTDDSLSIDSYNVACRLLDDFTAVKLDEEGNEADEVTVKAGSAMILETVRGEGNLYLPPTQRSRSTREFIYDCRLADGERIRFVSAYESTIFTEGAYMNRFTQPVSLWEAQFDEKPGDKERFTVKIGDREYPVISDYTQKDHTGEEIDFGGEDWWQVEGYTGRYVMTKDDRREMEGEYYTGDALSRTKGGVTLKISADGHAVLDYFGLVFEGDLPEKRFYREDVTIRMDSAREWRTFQIRLREGDPHSVPEKIEVYSEGLPATNEPSKVPPLMIYLTKQ